MKSMKRMKSITREIWVGFFCCGLLLGFSNKASADDQHYQDFIVGDEAVGMGGAFTALSADPSGGWYNPAGIVDVRNTSLSLSANLYGIQDSAVGSTDELMPEDALGKLTVVPSSTGFVQALGRTDMHGRRPYAFGLSLMVPSYRKYSTHDEGEINDPIEGLVRYGYNRSYVDETLWAGLMGAMRLGGRLSIGGAVFLVHRSVSDKATSFVAGDFIDGEFSAFHHATMDLEFFNDSLLAVLGAKLKLSNKLYVGAMVRSPSLTIYSRGQMRYGRARSDGLGDVGFIPTPEGSKVKSESRINGEARVGIAYVWPKVFKIAADVSAHLPVSYTLIDVQDEAVANALLIAPEVEREFVINGNLGVEFLFLDRFSVAMGGFTNFSSAPEIPGNQTLTAPAPARVHMFGGTFAAGYSSEHTLTRIGMLYARGSGHDVQAVDPAGQLASQEQTFTRVPLTQSYVYFFMSSTFRY